MAIPDPDPLMRSKTFCILPWIHAATLPDGDVRLCCVSGGGSGVNLNEQTLSDYWGSEYVKDARRRMLAGEEVNACQHCYKEEAQGYRSHRMAENDSWSARCGETTLQALVAGTAQDGTLAAGLQYVDLRLGNTCNMQCVMCHPRESSRWLPAAKTLSTICQDGELREELARRATFDTSALEWHRNADFWSNLKTFLPDVKQIILAGGEPFLIEEQFSFIKACCDLGEAGHIRLRYHTNGTVFPEEMTGYWKQFDRVHFLISLDGIGDVANYVRYPSHWNAIEDNIRRFDALGANTLTTFLFTAHALNVYRLPELLEWADGSRLRNRNHFGNVQDYVSVNLVHRPEHLNIRVLPADYKQLVTQRISEYLRTRLNGQLTDQLTGVLRFMNAEDHSQRMPQLVEYTRILDISRGTGLFETFPELSPYWTRAGNAG